MLSLGALRKGNQDRGNLQKQDLKRQRINREIQNGTSPIGQKYENMKTWQQKLLDGDYSSKTVTNRLRDSCFGKLMLHSNKLSKKLQNIRLKCVLSLRSPGKSLRLGRY